MTTMYVDFHLSSNEHNFDFSDIILFGEIKKNNIGDMDKKRNRVITSCNWSCCTEEKNFIFTNDALNEFYENIKVNFNEIKKRIIELNLEVDIYVVINTTDEDDTFGVTFNKEILKMCTELNADLSVDTIFPKEF